MMEKSSGGDGTAADSVKDVELERLRQENIALQQRLDKITQRLMDPEFLSKLRGEATTPVMQPVPPVEEEEEPDWESMTPKQLAKKIADDVLKKVQQEIQPRLEDVATRAEVIRARQEIEEAQRKHPDFMQYRDLMIQVANEYAAKGHEIHAEDAYFIAKGRAAAMARQTSPPPAPAPPPAPKKSPSVERPGVSPTAVQRQSIGGKEAAEEAWKRLGLDNILKT